MATPPRTTKELQQRAEWLASQTFVVLAISVPKDNDKTPQSAEQFFAALHGIYRNDPIEQEHIGFEIVAKKDAITFYVFTPLHLRDLIESQLYAQYPDLQIHQVSDYTAQVDLEGQHVAATNMKLTKEDVYPIKTFSSSEVDPLAGITSVLSGLEDKEQVWLQIVVRPVGDDWQGRGVKYVSEYRKTGKEPGKGPAKPGFGAQLFRSLGRGIVEVAKEFSQPGSGFASSEPKKEDVKLSAPQEAALKGIESKITKLGFETIFRLVSISSTEAAAKARIQALLAAFKQYNTTNLNGFTGGDIKTDDFASWEQYVAREFEETGNIMNIEELASVYHFPTADVETNAISWAGSKKSEAPYNLPLKDKVDPKDLTVLGRTDFRSRSAEFGIKMDDRMRHIYVIGKSGVGKSTLLENMIYDDIQEGRGVIVVDPHGELADKTIDMVPEHRMKDVIYFDPSDRDFPIAFNILDVKGLSEDLKVTVASGFVAALKKIFGNSWGPRLEYILRNATLALLDTEYPTMLGIPRILTDPGFRNQVIPQIKDPVVLDFWKNEWAAKEQKQQVEEMGSILNKVGQFLSSSLIRNVVGQPTSGFDMRRAMDESKILVVNLSKGKIGEDNSALLGTMMITKVQLAAMSRANVAPSERPACFLYVDEFQNFATESFATILSEARKYNLGLTVAHQYIAQMTPEVKDAVFGNVGSMISFRVGSEDAVALRPEFTPVFDENDLVNLQRGFVYIKLLIDGLAMPAFSAQTLPPRKLDGSLRDQVVALSRTTYAKPRAEAEALIDETAGYKQKREAEAAAKAAKELLQQGTQAIGIRPGGAAAGTGERSAPSAPRPQQGQWVPKTPYAAPAAAPTPKPVQTPVPAPEPPAQPLPAPAQEAPVPAMVHAPEVPAIIEQKPNIDHELAPVTELSALEQAAQPDIQVADAEGQGSEASEKEKERVEKPPKVMDGWVYKEVAQKGGLRWFMGETEAQYAQRMQEKQLKEAQDSAVSDSPALISPAEQRANNEATGGELKTGDMAGRQAPDSVMDLPLEDGAKIEL